MGMYTELHFNSALKEDTPADVLDVLRYMVGLHGTLVALLPEHQLFQTERWKYMLRGDSYYFDADTHSTLRYDDIANQHFLCIRCNLKNYSDEIEKFIDWIMPHLDKFPGEFLGFYRYEESEEPTLIYQKECV